jgi:hypothetical protein
LAVYTTLIQECGTSTRASICGNKSEFKASLSSQSHKGGMKNICLNISPSIMKTFELSNLSKNDKTMTQNKEMTYISKMTENDQKRPVKYTLLYPRGHGQILYIYANIISDITH